MPIAVNWIVGHHTIRSSHTTQQKANTRRNHEVDGLAKMAAGVPLPDMALEDVLEVHVGGWPAPTPATKWILQRRVWPRFTRAHWVTWLPLKGRRCPWLAAVAVGNHAMENRCAAPWSKEKGPSPFPIFVFLLFRLVLIDTLSQVRVWTLGLWQVSPPAYIVQY